MTNKTIRTIEFDDAHGLLDALHEVLKDEQGILYVEHEFSDLRVLKLIETTLSDGSTCLNIELEEEAEEE